MSHNEMDERVHQFYELLDDCIFFLGKHDVERYVKAWHSPTRFENRKCLADFISDAVIRAMEGLNPSTQRKE